MKEISDDNKRLSNEARFAYHHHLPLEAYSTGAVVGTLVGRRIHLGHHLHYPPNNMSTLVALM